MKLLQVVIVSSVALFWIGCSQVSEEIPDKPVQVATVTGTAVGAGLGAIIGSQTGDALGGTAIGAVAGAGAGYAVGSYLEDKDTTAALREEQLRRQDQQIQNQQRELNELRGVSGDSVTFNDPRASYKARSVRSGVSNTNGSTKTYIDPATLVNPFADKSVSNNSVATVGATRGSVYSYSGASGVSDSLNSPRPELGSTELKERSLISDEETSGMTSVAAIPTARIPNFDADAAGHANQENVNAAEEEVFQNAKMKTEEKRSAQAIEKEIQLGIDAASNTQDVNSKVVPMEVSEPVAGNADGAGESLQIAVEVPAQDQAEDTTAGQEDSSIARSVTLPNDSEECVKATAEAKRGATAESTADKLFYFRRALRLCPDAPEWHVELGKVYSSLGRFDDAKFEYEEALKIEPGYRAAQSGLDALQRNLY